MIDFNEINEALKTVQMKASDIREIKGVLNKKFHLYFESDEVKVLACRNKEVRLKLRHWK